MREVRPWLQLDQNADTPTFRRLQFGEMPDFFAPDVIENITSFPWETVYIVSVKVSDLHHWQRQAEELWEQHYDVAFGFPNKRMENARVVGFTEVNDYETETSGVFRLFVQIDENLIHLSE